MRKFGLPQWLLVIAACLLMLPGVLKAQDTGAEPAAVPAEEPAKDAPEQFNHDRFVRYMSGTETCLACHGSFNPIVRKPTDQRHSLWLDSEMLYQSVHARLGCTSCHTNIDSHGHRTTDSLDASNNCAPCHTVENDKTPEELAADREKMEILAGVDPIMTEALRACITCHEQEFNDYSESVHGVSLMEHRVLGSPFCTDCHGIHYILPADDERSATNPANVPNTCLACHAKAEIKTRAGLTREIKKSFEDSFHGKRGEAGGDSIAVCSNCHGSHQVFAASDPRSLVNQTQIAKTCSECHAGAQLSFAAAFTHKTISPGEQTGLYILQQIYSWLIFLLIAGFVVFAMLDIFQHIRHKKLGDVHLPERPRKADKPKAYERFNLHHRIQHFFMAFPFTMLVLTGWPMRFPELEVSKIVCAMVGGVEVVGIMHRVFGVTLILVSIYHIAYLLTMFFKGHRSKEMLPVWLDAVEIYGDIMYWLGLRKTRPRFGRYNWIEKVEYYAVIWGTLVMILSGIIIWFPSMLAEYLPEWAVPASVIVHGYEALLAGLAIFVWHFYWVHLHPSIYPMSMVWLTGKLTEEEMRHHHPRELEKLQAEKPSAEVKQ